MSWDFTWSSPNNGRPQRDDYWAVTLHRSNQPRLRRIWSDARRFRGLGEMIDRFGKKLAMVLHEARARGLAAYLERERLVRRFGVLTLSGVVLERRRGRVAGESNYYRVMLC
jgi:hypothetical protein